MRSLHEAVEVSAEPGRVWEWLMGLADNYQDWHPDHVSAAWVGGPANRVGSVLEVVERLGGRTERLRFELTDVAPPRRFAYRMRGPISVLLPRGAFAVEPADGGSRFHATIDCRFPRLAQVLFPRRIEVLRAHMREEGENLKRILESGHPPAASSAGAP